ncbi:MAG: hypothetical protein ACP5HK_06145 [Acidilobus sp.]
MRARGLAIALILVLAIALGAQYLPHAAAQQAKYLLKFMLTYLPKGMLWAVSVNGTIQTNSSNVISFFLSPGVYSYLVTYFNATSGRYLTVASGTVHLTANYTLVINVFKVDFTQVGLPTSALYKVYVNSTFMVEGSGTLSMWLPQDIYSYSAWYYNSTFSEWVPLGRGILELFANESVSLPAYSVKVWVLGLPPGIEWYMVINSSFETPYEPGNLTLLLGPGVYSYDLYSYNETSYSTTLIRKGTFTISGNETVIIPYPATYNLTVLQVGLPQGTPWYLTVNGTRMGPFTNSSVTLRLRAGVYSYAVSFYYAPLRLGVLEAAGVVYLGSNQQIVLTPHFYNVTVVAFEEAPGLSWELLLNGTPVINFTTSAVRSTLVPSGVYRYEVITYYAPLGTSELVTSGPLVLDQNTTVSFYGGLYTVTFTLSGVPPATPWDVYIDGKKVASSSLPTLTIQLPQGNYTYLVSVYYKDLSSYINVSSGRIYVNSSQTIAVSMRTYSLTLYYSTKPPDVYWQVFINGVRVAGGQSDYLSALLPGGSYHVTVMVELSVPRENMTVASISVNVTSNLTLPVPVSFYSVAVTPQQYPGGVWWLLVNGTLVGPLTSSGVSLDLLQGTYNLTAIYYDAPLRTNVTAASRIIYVASSTAVPLPFTLIRGLTVKISSMPANVSWELVINGTVAVPVTSNASATLPVPSTPLTYSLTFYYPGGKVTPISGTLPSQGPISLVFPTPVSVLYITVQGLPPGGEWLLMVNGSRVGSWRGDASATVYLLSGPASYAILWRTANLTFRGPSGTVNLNGSLQLTVALPQTYAVAFAAPPGMIRWSLYINGTLSMSPTNTQLITLYLPAGFYRYYALVQTSSGAQAFNGTISVPAQTSVRLVRPSAFPTIGVVAAIIVVAVVVAGLLFIRRR